MDHYLVELYLPRRDQSALADAAMRARAVSDQLASEGTHVRYVQTIFVPVDEVCFHLFEAESAEAVARAAERASISSARIVGAVPLPFAEGDQRHHVSPRNDAEGRSNASAQVVEEAIAGGHRLRPPRRGRRPDRAAAKADTSRGEVR